MSEFSDFITVFWIADMKVAANSQQIEEHSDAIGGKI